MSLPIYAVLDQLKTTVKNSPTVLLSAAPGAGKTTVVPLALLNEPFLANKKILMLEPRRMAARNAANFMAQSLGEKVGETVGYRLRLENKISAKTRLEVITEGVLTRMLQDDNELIDVGLVIFDEFHERHLQGDLGLALTLSCQELLRSDLKILIMSATLDDANLAKFKAPLIQCPGQSFPLTIFYRPQPLHNSDLILHSSQVIQEALRFDGDILVFLPGLREISLLQENLEKNPNLAVYPLHGSLSDDEQKAALMPAPNGHKKIILATNIAESSLTISGVRTVVDSGLMRRNEFDLASGLSLLKTRFIAQSSATQRAGRAAREASGQCFRLWSESAHTGLDAHLVPEISHSDLAPLLLELYQWGVSAYELQWPDAPAAKSLAQAKQLLASLGFLNDDQSALSAHGKACAQIGLEPRLAHALLALNSLNQGQKTAELIAFLQEYPANKRHSDDLLRAFLGAQKDRLWQTRIQPFAKTLAAKLPAATQNTAFSLEECAALLLALAYPDRIAQKRSHNEQFLLANGKGAKLSTQSDLFAQELLACADFTLGKESVIRLACALPYSLLPTLKELAPQIFGQRTLIGFQENGQYQAKEQQTLGKIVLKSQDLPQLSAAQWQSAWRSYIEEKGLDCLHFDSQALELRARLKLAHAHLGAPWPDVSDEALLGSIDQWLLPFLQDAKNLRALEKIDYSQALLSLLDYAKRQQLAQLLPTHIEVPSGSLVAIDYRQSPPVLAVKLQEMFGYQGQPTVLNGKLALLIHLLSPAKHPLQVTQDLMHFWQHGYKDVCKEMRGRYPKHPWPDDPLSASATRLTKRHLI